MISGGEALEWHHYEILKKLNSEIVLFNEYGPTECTVGCMIEEVKEHPVSIGRPVDNTRVYILDGEGQVVPYGIYGELYLSGRSLSEGYYNDVEKTNEKFIELNAERLYKTGDLVRWMADGRMSYAGRRRRPGKDPWLPH